MLSSNVYDFLKKLVQIILPAAASAYFALAGIWDLPNAEQVVGTIAVITTFLGVCLGISSSKYNANDGAFDGQLVVTDKPDGSGKVYSIDPNDDLDALDGRESITLKITKDSVG